MNNWINSVYSDSTKYFVSNPQPLLHEEITISLRMLENREIKKVFLRYREYGFERLVEMKQQKKDNLFYYHASVKIHEKRFQYQFYLVTEHKIYYYTQYHISDVIPNEARDFVIVANLSVPDWIQNAVFYQIFPDRFCNGMPDISVQDQEYCYQGHKAQKVKEWNTPTVSYEVGHNLNFYGGDLYGIIQKLDYLQELGVNAIYLNPVFVSPSTHKYDTLDYFEVDKHLGGNEGLKRLCQEIHARGMKIILDISINHTSSDGKWFNKDATFYSKEQGAYSNIHSKEREYYFFDANNEYDTWCGVQTMPKLNYSSKRLRNVIYGNKNSILKKWMREPYSIDGWRFDVAECIGRNEVCDVHAEVLQEIREELKKVNSKIYLLAEDWADCSEDLQGNRWDATMNYFGCARPLREYAGEKDLFLERNQELKKIDNKLTGQQLTRRIEQFYTRIPGMITYQMFNLLGSHDVSRLYNSFQVAKEDYLSVLCIMFLLPGAANIYYGDEILLPGNVEEVDFCRNPMDWQWNMKSDSKERFAVFQKLTKLKRTSTALSDGGVQFLHSENNVFGIIRFSEKEMVFEVCTNDDEEQTITVPFAWFGFHNRLLTIDFFGKAVKSEIREDGVKIRIPPHSGYLFKISN